MFTGKGGSVFREGEVFELFAVGQKPTVVTMDGHMVPEVQGDLDMSGVGTGWRYDVDRRGGQVSVRMPVGQHEIRVHFP